MIEQFTHLRSCIRVAKIKPNSKGVIQYVESNGVHMFERIYVYLEACMVKFTKTCRHLISLDSCFLKRGYGRYLMATVDMDENNHIFSIAYVVV